MPNFTVQSNIIQRLRLNTKASLDLSMKVLSDTDLKELAEALKVNSTITTIDLRSNKIDAAGAQALAEALKVNSTITTIDLMHNQIGAAGAQALAEALKQKATITRLDLAWNQVGDAGAQALAEALKTNPTLTTLKLGVNEIGAAGAQALAEALKTNRTITTLYLRDNQIGDAGIQVLIQALKKNHIVTEIDIALTNQTLSSLLKRNRQFKNICENLQRSILDLERSVQFHEMTQDTLYVIFQKLEKIVSFDTGSLPSDYPGFSELKEKMNSLIPAFHSWVVNLPRSTQGVDVNQFRLDLLSRYAEISPKQLAYDVAQFELAHFYRAELDLARQCLTDTSVISDEESENYLEVLIHFLIHAENYNAQIETGNEKIITDKAYDRLINIVASGKIEPQLDIHRAPEAEQKTRELFRKVINEFRNKLEGIDKVSGLKNILKNLRDALSFEQVVQEEQAMSSRSTYHP